MSDLEPQQRAGCSLWLLLVVLSSLSPLIAVAVIAVELGWLAAICALPVGLCLGYVNFVVWVCFIRPTTDGYLRRLDGRSTLQLLLILAFYVGAILSGLLMCGLAMFVVAQMVQS